MKCIKCGEFLTDEENKCPNCGEVFNKVVINVKNDDGTHDFLQRKNKRLISYAIILTVLIFTSYFEIPFNNLFVLKADIRLENQHVNRLLSCKKNDVEIKSIVNMIYDNDNLKYYDIEYKLDSSNRDLFNIINGRVSSFKNYSGFYYESKIDENELVLKYTISLDAVNTEEVEDLIDNINYNYEEKKNEFITDGYICE